MQRAKVEKSVTRVHRNSLDGKRLGGGEGGQRRVDMGPLAENTVTADHVCDLYSKRNRTQSGTRAESRPTLESLFKTEWH